MNWNRLRVVSTALVCSLNVWVWAQYGSAVSAGLASFLALMTILLAMDETR